MKFSTLMTTLASGSLGNLPIFGEGTGVPQDQAYVRTAVAVNQALTEFYTRFAIRNRTLIFEAIDGRFQYPLDPMYAYNSGVAGDPKYILDSLEDPWLEMDILWINRVLDDCGREAWVNATARTPRENQPIGRVFVTESNVVQLSYPKAGHQYTVEYRGAPELLDPETIDPDVDEFMLPTVYVPAFVEKVSALIYRSLNGQENTAKGAELTMSSEIVQTKLEDKNVDNKESATYNERFSLNGWI